MIKKYKIIPLILIFLIYLISFLSPAIPLSQKIIDSNSKNLINANSSIVMNNNLHLYNNFRSNSTKPQINPFKDLILINNQIRTINTDFKLNGNLTLIHNSTLIIQNAKVVINGWMNLTNSSKLFIYDSILNIIPPQLNENTTIVNLTGNSNILIERSSIEIYEQSIETRAPFILSDENSKVEISDSTLITHYPPVPLEIRWGTSGLLLLAGSANWTIKDTKIYANMNVMGAYRWCIIQGSAHFRLINVENYMNDPVRNAFIKPNAGFLECFNSRLLGRMPIAVVGQAKIENSTIFAGLEILDSAKAIVENSSVKKIQIGFWSGVPSNNNLPSPKLTLSHSGVDTVYVSGNSSANLFDSEIKIMLTADKNARLLLDGILFNTPINPVTISDNVNLTINRPVGLHQVMVLSGHCNLKLNNLSIMRLTINREFLNLKLINASINQFRTFNNMVVKGDLVDSKIEEFINSELKYGNGFFNFTLINSVLPPLIQSKNITTIINYRLNLKFTLNNKDINKNAFIKIHNRTGSVIAAKQISNSNLLIDLPRTIVNDSKIIENEFYKIESKFMGFSFENKIWFNKSSQINISWHDLEKPKISNIKSSPSDWNSQKFIVIRSKVTDNQIKVISNVSLFYSTTDGRSWKIKKMYNVNGDEYEAIIPGQDMGTTITYYITAYDMAGNYQESKKTTLEVGQKESGLFNGILISSFVIFIILIIIQINRKRKIQRYKSKTSMILDNKNRLINLKGGRI